MKKKKKEPEEIGRIFIVLGTNDNIKFQMFADTGEVKFFDEVANLVLKKNQQIEHFVEVALPNCRYRVVFELVDIWGPNIK